MAAAVLATVLLGLRALGGHADPAEAALLPLVGVCAVLPALAWSRAARATPRSANVHSIPVCRDGMDVRAQRPLRPARRCSPNRRNVAMVLA